MKACVRFNRLSLVRLVIRALFFSLILTLPTINYVACTCPVSGGGGCGGG